MDPISAPTASPKTGGFPVSGQQKVIARGRNRQAHAIIVAGCTVLDEFLYLRDRVHGMHESGFRRLAASKESRHKRPLTIETIEEGLVRPEHKRAWRLLNQRGAEGAIIGDLMEEVGLAPRAGGGWVGAVESAARRIGHSLDEVVKRREVRVGRDRKAHGVSVLQLGDAPTIFNKWSEPTEEEP